MGGKQNPYQMWQAGISLAASPLSNSSRALAMESGGSAATRPPSHPASYEGYVFHAPCFPRPVLSTPRAFHAPCFPRPVLSKPCVFHTRCFPHTVFSIRPRVFHAPCFQLDLVFSTSRVFHTLGPYTPGHGTRVFHLAKT